MALTECVVAVSVVIGALVALAPERGTGEPKLEPSITNRIVPLGVPGLPGLTVAVNVTDSPYTDGLREETRAVVLLEGATGTVKVALPWPPSLSVTWIVTVRVVAVP